MTHDPNSMLSLVIHMMGSISLLLWGSHTVRTSMERSFGATLNQLVSRLAHSPFKAVFGGILIALMMQSATATILLATQLLGSGALPLVTAMAIVLGADMGSAIATKLLFLDLSLLPPVLLIVGMVLYLSAHTWRVKYFGRIVIGLGLMLLSIQLMKQVTAPLADSPLPAEWLLVLQSIPWISMLVIAVITWFFHSSVAVVLIVASLSQSRIIPPELFIPMLLGANIGAGFIAVPLVARSNLEGRSVVLTNLILRVGLALVLSLTIPFWVSYLPVLSPEPGAQVILLHISFNFMLILLFAPFAARLAGKMRIWLQTRSSRSQDPLSAIAGAGLDHSMMDKPELAISCARREAYRLGDITETLFSRALEMFRAEDQSEIERFVELDREINARNRAIHQYLSEVRRHVSNPDDEKALDQVLHFASTMENIGDTISHNLSRLAGKRLGRGVDFSNEGMTEISNIHAEVLTLLDAEINLFASNQPVKRKKNTKGR